jgi:Acetyltransferase (GNAT) domain
MSLIRSAQCPTSAPPLKMTPGVSRCSERPGLSEGGSRCVDPHSKKGAANMAILKDSRILCAACGRDSVAVPASQPLENFTARSIFHEPWWLDIATGGQWNVARVTRGNELLGEMPYYHARVGLWRVSHLPPLTRTLGPVIKRLDGGASARQECHHRVSITSQLIEQMPHFDSFFQVFDPSVKDALAFSLHGFNISARYTFELSPMLTKAQAWAGLRGKTRNLIRSAEKALTVAPIATPSEFLDFYEANLASRGRTNTYGASLMRQLVNAFVERKAGRLLGAYGADGRMVAAIGLVWDRRTMHYLLSSRAQTAHSGSISLLIWAAMQSAIDQQLTFDFDGFANPNAFHFLSRFGGTLKQRLGVERISTTYSVVRTLKRHLSAEVEPAFVPNM